VFLGSIRKLITWTERSPRELFLENIRSVVGLYTVPAVTGTNLVAAITPPKDPEPGLIYGRQISGKVDYTQLKSWVSRCCNNHRTCGLTQRPSLTTYFRVIDCRTRAFQSFDSKEDIDFVTLSYLWGKPKEHGPGKGEQLPATFGAWKSEHGLPTILPKTIQDCMTVVTNLGYRYLWVDRYCIPQGRDEDSI
jgi:hypothetical protein